MKLQESREERSKNAIGKEIEVQEMRPQYQIVQMNESSEQSLNAVIPSPFLNQHFPDSYSLIPVSEINFIISKNFKFYDRNKLRVMMTKYLEPISTGDGEVSEELRLLLTYLALSTSSWKTTTRVFNNYSIYESYQGYIEDETLKRVTRFYPS